MEYAVTKQPLGIPLVPNQENCLSCGGKLSLRSDRPSRLTIYTESQGTVTATHYHKYCRNKGCKFVQYYGYHKPGNGYSCYNNNWISLPYFIPSQETGFEIAMLKKFDVELLIGQMSYHQKADIYNVANGYDNTKKNCSTIENEAEKAHCTSIHG